MCRNRFGRPAGLLVCCLCLAGCLRPAPAPDFGPVGDFSLTERSKETVTQKDLLGKAWVASFVFTRCTGPCPQVSATMARLQADFAGRPDVRLVTFTVDPEHDDPGELTRYAGHFQADPQRWLFLTGKEADVYRLLRHGFKVAAEQNKGEDRKPGAEVMHDVHLVVVDKRGHLRGYFLGVRSTQGDDPEEEFEANLKALKQTVAALERETPAEGLGAAIDFPATNALLNGTSGVLLVLGYLAIRRRQERLHIACMLSALVVSALFLASYLYYHLAIRQGQPTSFARQWPEAPDWVRLLYLAILGTHTVLAVVVAPLALVTAFWGLKDRRPRHVRLARWTLPLWLYVSVTGVVVYWMLYRLYAAG